MVLLAHARNTLAHLGAHVFLGLDDPGTEARDVWEHADVWCLAAYGLDQLDTPSAKSELIMEANDGLLPPILGSGLPKSSSL